MGMTIPGTYQPAASNAGTIRITLKLYATLGVYLPEGAKRNQIGLDVPANATVNELIAPLHMPLEHVSLVVLNGEILLPPERASRHLAEGDVLAIWPPVAGG
jgi:sulfur carrier protein ThiS